MNSKEVFGVLTDGCFDPIADKKAELAQDIALNNLDYVYEISAVLGSAFPEIEKELDSRKKVRGNLSK